MRKKILVITMCMCMAFATAACSGTSGNNSSAQSESGSGSLESEGGSQAEGTNQESSGETDAPTDTKADIYNTNFQDNGYVKDIKAADLVKLYDYSQVKTIAKADVEPSDEEVQATIDETRKMFSTTNEVKDRAVKDGDIICMDFTGKIDGVEFDGGKSENYVFDPAYDNFIDGFYEQIIGHTPSEEPFDIQVKFPDPYEKNPDLSGKDATFTIVLHYIEENILPEFNDEYVKEKLGGSVSAEEYRQQIKDALQQEKVLEYLYDAVISNSTVDTIPDALMDSLKAILDDSSSEQAAQIGLSLEDFYKQMGATEEKRIELCEQQAKAILVVQAVAEKEGVEATDDNVIEYFGNADTRDGYTEYFGKGYAYSGALPILTMQKLAEGITVE